MPIIKNKLEIVADPSRPVQEICDIISAIAAFHPGAEADILKGVQKAIDERLQAMEKKQDSAE